MPGSRKRHISSRPPRFKTLLHAARAIAKSHRARMPLVRLRTVRVPRIVVPVWV